MTSLTGNEPHCSGGRPTPPGIPTILLHTEGFKIGLFYKTFWLRVIFYPMQTPNGIPGHLVAILGGQGTASSGLGMAGTEPHQVGAPSASETSGGQVPSRYGH